MRKVSNCCSARPVSYGDIDSEDLGICSRCMEPCEYEDDPKDKIKEMLNKIIDNNSELLALADGLNEENKATYSKKIAAIINETILIMKKTPQANGA